MAYEWTRGHYKNDIYAYTRLTYKMNKYVDLLARTSATTYDLMINEYGIINNSIDGELVDIVKWDGEKLLSLRNEKGKLVLQPLGRVVMEFLEKRFDELFNYNYTSLMEDALDKIAKGELIWHELCNSCNKQIDNLVDGLKDETKIEIKIDENNTYMIGKYGPVIKCVEEVDGKEEITFKPIKKDVDNKLLEKENLTVEELVDTNKSAKTQYILGQHNGKDVILRKGKFGLYISWGENSKTLKELGNRPIENITFDEVKKYLYEGSNLIREINSSLSIRKGPKGDYIFYKTSKMKKPEFKDIKSFATETSEDYKICDITILKSWISEKYNL
jgi:DNA topoisomerase-1